MSTSARRVRVRGRVHGVFFRDSCTDEARRLGVTGWVRNEDDGSVLAHVEGEPEGVEALVRWCGTGPPRAEVDGVEQDETEVEGHTEFRVR